MIHFKESIRRGAQFSAHFFHFVRGYAAYLRTGATPWESFLSMRHLSCATNGWLNDVVASLYRCFRPSPRPEPTSWVLGTLNPREVGEITAAMHRDGCYVFKSKVPAEICDRLVEFASRTPMNGTIDGQAPPPAIFNPAKPQWVRSDCDQQTLMENPTAQMLAADPGIRLLAQTYLRTEAVQDRVCLWWSAPVGKEASSAAQLYQFDLDRIRFLKCFIYLSDVGPENGPHCFIRRSHKRKPRSLLRMQRFSDEEIFEHYPRENLIEIVGQKGTMFMADTAGFHKGKPLAAGHRLIFQIEFAIDQFGNNYPRISINEHFTPAFRQAVDSHPYTYGNYAA